jgi:hypothetical protein
MGRARFLLILAAVAFVGWVGFLGWLALGPKHPVILSRSQFVASPLAVVARVDNADAPRVTVEEVAWAPEGREALAGQQITVTNLSHAQGWQGPDAYILALRGRDGTYEVTPIPRSPALSDANRSPRIYRATADTRQQLHDLPRAAQEP